MTFPVRPILGRVIIKRDKLEEVTTESGIIIHLESDGSDQQRGGTNRVGVVVAFDAAFYDSLKNTKHETCPDISIGDRVFFSASWIGEPFEFDGEEFYTLEGDDVAAHCPEGVVVEAHSR